MIDPAARACACAKHAPDQDVPEGDVEDGLSGFDLPDVKWPAGHYGADLAAASPASLGLMQLERELYRSRRYDRPLALIGHPVRSRGQVGRLQRLVRAADLVWVDGDSLFILAPESNHENVTGLF